VDTSENERPIPRVRTVVHRGFLSSESSRPLILTTTDIRTPKAHQIQSNRVIEIGWFIRPTEEQFRITGFARLSPHPKFHSFAPDTQTQLPDLDLDAERRRIFNSVSGAIRASFCRPVPGSPLPGGYEEGKKWPVTLPKLAEWKNEQERVQVETAFENFALLLIEPFNVDLVELAPSPNQRTFFERIGDANELRWKEQIVVP